jgi:hypothetical protein
VRGMKTYGDSMDVRPLILNFGIGLRVSVRLYALAVLLPVKDFDVH